MTQNMKIAFFEVKDYERDYINKAFSGMNVELYPQTLHEVLASNKDLNNISIISTFINSSCSSDNLSKISGLKLIATRSTGFDHIDLKFCASKGISVTNVPNYGQSTVAEHAMALLLTLAKRIPESIDVVRGGRFSSDGLTGIDLKDKIVGVIGTGNIGKNFISMAKGFGMNVIAFDLNPNKELEDRMGFAYVDFNYLLGKSDVISLHVPYIKTTHHLIGKDAISKMKPGVIIINTSRGGLIDTDSLFEALVNKKIRAVGLDVLEEENFMKDEKDFLLAGKEDVGGLDLVVKNHVLATMPNVVITPHNAFNTAEALVRIIQITIENIHGFIENKPVNLVS
jgi:D-lactate dehydrogenase